MIWLPSVQWVIGLFCGYIAYGAAAVLLFCLEANRKYELGEFSIEHIDELNKDDPVLVGRVKKTSATRGGKKQNARSLRKYITQSNWLKC